MAQKRERERDFGKMDSWMVLHEQEWLACCGSVKFAQEMVSAGPFSNYEEALEAAKDIWFNKVDVNGWLEAFDAHPPIGESPLTTLPRRTSALWTKVEHSTALATATESTLQELYEWNCSYMEKFGFVFLIFASGRSTPEILAEMKRRYQNRPIVEFELAAQEQMKIFELRLSKLFAANAPAGSTNKTPDATDVVTKAGGSMSDCLFPAEGSTEPQSVDTSDVRGGQKRQRLYGPGCKTSAFSTSSACSSSSVPSVIDQEALRRQIEEEVQQIDEEEVQQIDEEEEQRIEAIVEARVRARFGDVADRMHAMEDMMQTMMETLIQKGLLPPKALSDRQGLLPPTAQSVQPPTNTRPADGATAQSVQPPTDTQPVDGADVDADLRDD